VVRRLNVQQCVRPDAGIMSPAFAATLSGDLRRASENAPGILALAGNLYFVDGINSDLAFTGPDVIQGSFNGYQVWDISNPSRPSLKTAYVCPGSQSDVSVYHNLLFVSGENLAARLDCGTQGVEDTVSAARLRGIRIYDISDIAHPKHVGNVQTCRGSHTHTLLVDPKDRDNVYVYVSGQAPVRSPSELAGCVSAPKDPNSALFRIEVIKVPLAHPEQAAIVSSPRIFNNLVAPPKHGDTPEDSASNAKEVAEAKAAGGFTGMFHGQEQVVHPEWVAQLLDSLVKARNGTGAPSTWGGNFATGRSAPSAWAASRARPSPC